jgi:hypothetical protein
MRRNFISTLTPPVALRVMPAESEFAHRMRFRSGVNPACSLRMRHSDLALLSF